MMEPPTYDGSNDEALLRSSHEDQQSELPAYTRRPTPPPTAQVDRTPKEFTYEIKSRGGRGPWAMFIVRGDPVLSRAVMPTITQGTNLAGSVKLDLQSTETIQAVCILIRGEVVDSAASPISFLEAKHTLWTAAENGGKSKLKGDYEFPFNVEIPTTFSKNGKMYNAPHTFMEKVSSISVRYTAELRIVRGKLRPDDKVTCTFGYFSMQQPGPSSELRRLAYQENSPLLGPDADPEGWHTQPVSATGKLFASRSLDAKCTFSLANPLSYPRSASIPCAITIESTDTQALDLLSSPTASIVYLERSTKEKLKDAQWNITTEPCAQAVFWTSTEGAAETPHRRQLMGEIHLKANLQPSSAVPKFAIEYAVVVFPFQAAGFKASDTAPVLRQVVEITTRHPPGPRQKTYTPPTYETSNAIVQQYYRLNSLTGNSVRSGAFM